MHDVANAAHDGAPPDGPFAKPLLRDKVTIIMPAYNVDRFIGEAIESVLFQTYGNWELVVVDDGSTDETPAVISRYTDRRISVIRQPNSGLTGARNAGLAYATGEWILFLDSDDSLRPDALEVLVASTRPASGSRPVAVYGDFMRISEAGEPLGRRDLLAKVRFLPRPSGDMLRFFLQGFVLMIGTSLVRADVLRKVGLLQRGFEPMEDWVYFTLFSTFGPFVCVDHVVMNYRMRSTSLSMTDGLDIARYQPALDGIFEHPWVKARFGAEDLEALRADREASIYNFIAAQCIRARDYRAACRAYSRSIRRSPRKAIKGATMIALAGLGM